MLKVGRKKNITFKELGFSFFIYSVIGWIFEVIFGLIKRHRILDRGFNFGPWCPIYGFSFVALIFLIANSKDSALSIFIYGFLVTTILELVTGYIMFNCFGKRLWNYSRFKIELGGYISLTFSLCWGLACVLFFKAVHPKIERFIAGIPDNIGNTVLVTLIIVIAADFILSVLSKLV